MSIVLMIVGIVLFFLLVVVHEWGHFIMAKRGGVVVEEFGIGFPPRLFKKKTKGGWIFTLNLLPLGGFVRLKGEHDTDDEVGSLGAASVWTKTKIMAAGVTMNLVAAYVLLVVLALVGMPQIVDNQFTIKSDASYLQHARKYIAAGDVVSGSPAYQAGIRTDDTIVAFGAPGHLTPLTQEGQLPSLTQELAGKPAIVQYKHANGPMQTKAVTLLSAEAVKSARASGKQSGYLGVSVYQAQQGADVIRSTWSAPIVAAGVIKQFTVLTFQGLGKALAGLAGMAAGWLTHNTVAREAAQTQASSQVAGPVGIFFIFRYASEVGLRFVLLIVALLSLTLAIMNILPIPALDGGRLWLMLITRALKHPLSAEREEAINAGGFAFLMGILILVTLVDVRRFF